jgi:hypothetical protein
MTPSRTKLQELCREAGLEGLAEDVSFLCGLEKVLAVPDLLSLLWRPIEEAQRDGRWMLIYGPDVRPVQAHWNDAAEQWQRFNCCDRGLEPTHWMPLLSPPHDRDR